MFWLTFLQSRIPPVEPLGDGGRSHKPAYVMLVATHVDTVKRSGPGGQVVNMEDLRRQVVDSRLLTFQQKSISEALPSYF